MAAKIPRIFQRIFGLNAGLNEISKFGSLADGSPAYTTDAEEAMSLSPWLEGWFGAVIGNNSPAVEDMNAVFFALTVQLGYLFEMGIPEWNDETEYFIGSLVNDNGVIYKSLTDNNINQALSDPAQWRIVGGEVITTLGDTVYGDADGNMTRLPGITSTSTHVLTQTGDGVDSAAPEWKSADDFFLPPGMIVAYGGPGAAPPGWLLCDGQSYLNATYPNLFAAIGSAFGQPDGTHFNVPDFRGRFLRGRSGGTGNDPDAASRTASNAGGNTGDNIGSYQSDGFTSHTHNIPAAGGPGGSFEIIDGNASPGGVFVTTATGGNETRPKNIYVNYIIKT